MKIVHVNTSDINGGAARAAFRFNEALNKSQVNSQMLVQKKSGDHFNVKTVTDNKIKRVLAKFRSAFNSLFIKLYKKKKSIVFSTAKLGVDIFKHESLEKADIINLHWINGGFLSLNNIRKLQKLDKPIVWTLHDMWPFTGGCHYSNGCNKYEKRCGKCPLLNSNRNRDLTRKILKKKRKIYKELDLTIITCSEWLGECAKNSYVFKDLRVKVIPNTLDTNVFKPIGKKIARNILNLPQDKKLVLFGAINATSNPRKGFNCLKKSLIKFSDNGSKLNKKIELLVFGASSSDDIEKLPFKTRFIGRLYDNYTLALCYSAADIFVGPSLEEAFGQTYSEAMSCGTPCIAFNHSGPKDIIDHKKNGYLANYKSADDLAKGIIWCLNDKKRLNNLGNNARRKVLNNYSFDVISKQYLKLYRELLK
ncbi:MAG: glycosyltransferase [Candidatus Mcinerneyibacterium aminivorans]|uniref:Glycosyltransferase n=1 Tax=Candidatus Mcinerneyibacterium aminivorans TaxID=2703815 RepID=A0A5D0MNQ6_9BACT|nr:MAG: glycosyltransferase [Candidatus Mcinerneyibacterium aminivorans]